MRRAGGWVTAVPAARFEALVCLVRALVLLFSAASLETSSPVGVEPAVAFHLVTASASALLVFPLARARSATRVQGFAVASTVVDLLLCTGYAVAVDGRPGLGSLYPLLVLLLGPLRWGLRGVLATALPIGLMAVVWPVPDATGAAPGPVAVTLLVLLLSLPAAGLSWFWKRSGARLRQAQQLFEAAFEHASIGMALLDARLVVTQGNHALSGLLGVPVGELPGSSFPHWVEPSHREAVVRALQELPESPHAVRLEILFQRPDGGLRWGLLAASYLGGGRGVPAQVVAQVENVTDRKTAEQRLAHQALHDDLTGLPNRSYLRVRLEHALAAGGSPCVLFLDLDRFKVVNDGLGHAAGDRLLVEVAVRVQAAVRPGDLVARIGGDELVVLAAHVDDEEQAVALGERVLASLHAPVRVDRTTDVIVTASGGLALAGPDSTPETLLRDADTAMYEAKAQGGARVRVFTPELHQQARRTHELEVELRRAIERDQLSVAYQPVLQLATGRVVEAEALLRWHHPVRGDVPPSQFVPIAEQSGLIEDLGRWVLQTALADAAGWTGAPPPGVSVNVSLRQLADPAFPDHVAQALHDSGVPAGRLCLEVTETALLADTAPLVPVLRALRDLGVRLAIDDFGTGHASLTYLADLPVHVVKIDGTFVARVAEEAGSAAIVGGVVAMARAFGLAVVAEGVERPEQLEVLRGLGVELVQGYLLARPGPSALVSQPLVLVPEPRVVGSQSSQRPQGTATGSP